MKAKALVLMLAAAALGTAIPAAAHTQSYTAVYVGPDMLFPADCTPVATTGIACFPIGEAGHGVVDVSIADLTGIPMAVWAEALYVGGGGTAERFCQQGLLPIDPTRVVEQVVVHVEMFAGDFDCGPTGELHAPTAGEIKVTLR